MQDLKIKKKTSISMNTSFTTGINTDNSSLFTLLLKHNYIKDMINISAFTLSLQNVTVIHNRQVL